MFDDPLELEALGLLSNLHSMFPSDDEPSGVFADQAMEKQLTRAELRASITPTVTKLWDAYLASHPAAA